MTSNLGMQVKPFEQALEILDGCAVDDDLNPGYRSSLFGLSVASQMAMVMGARSPEPVRGLTHGFYKYPARFSPAFARAVIKALTAPGDLVIDNHVGGGTTLVEALALGRDAIGIDVSTLAEFVSVAKTAVLSESELKRLDAWADRVKDDVHLRKSSVYFHDYDALGYYKHLSHPARWRLRKGIEQALGSAMRLRPQRLETFGRCVVLRTAQWALDGRRALPTLSEFREMLTENGKEMVAGAREFADSVAGLETPPKVQILNRSAAGLEDDERMANVPTPRLVLTSPPYPGVHVLYHRWQVDGRKEAPLPFMIANKLDGAGSSYYTMGDRHFPELKTYFASIQASMASVAALADRDTIFVQMVAFSDISWQLDRYLEAMESAGLSETFLPVLCNEGDGRLWRSVPRRRWYSDQRGITPGSQEVVLFHRKLAQTTKPPRPRSQTDVHSRR